MRKTLAFLVLVAIWAGVLAPQRAYAQTLATFTSEASYTAALPAAGVTTTVEDFASVTTNRPVSTGTPDPWRGFTLVAQGTTEFGSSSYCTSLRACMNWTTAPPTLPGIYGAVSDPSLGNARLTFAPAARAFGFGLEHWDWNDGSQRSQIVVTLSNGAVFNVTSPTAAGSVGGFIGFRIDQASVNSGITITSVAWVAFSGNAEIIGMRNVRVSTTNPLVVMNTNDSGAGSLRNAITFANSQSTASTISFAIAGAGPHTIQLSSALPNLTANGLTIDGTTQSGTQCRDLWAGNGHDLRVNVRGGGFNGFQLAGTGQTIRGLSLTGFDNAIMTLAGSSTATIQCNYLGLLANGTSSSNTRGVLVRGASARIGGLDAGQGNVISANATVGVVTEQGSTDTAIRNNFIGTDAAGLSARANGTGINNFFGTATWRDITRNLISGNNGNAGIMLETDDRVTASDGQIRIQRNIIGFNRTLSALLTNTGDGIQFGSSSITNVLIGGIASSEGNQIAGGNDAIDLGAVSNITIRGNTLARSTARGIWIAGASNITIGGTAAGEGNTIGGNGADGIYIGGDAANITVLGNLIQPITIAGATASPNVSHGIWIERATTVNIGDGTAAGRNVIGGNRGRGIQSREVNANVTINGNYIGTDASGNVAVANGQNEGAATKDAIAWTGANFTNLAILNNVIGGYGDSLVEAFNTSGTGLTIQGNSIGVGADGASQIVSGNVDDLVNVAGASNSVSQVLIGGSGAGQGNIITFSSRSGIRLQSSGSNLQVSGNTIRNNTRSGIYVLGNTRAAIIGNRIFANGMLGIDLGDNGVTANDAGDADAGANEFLNFPQNIRAIARGTNQLGYSFTLDAPAAANGYRVEFFDNTAADPSGFGEGEVYLGHVDITHAGGTQSYAGTLTTLQPVAIGDTISATTTRRTAGGSWDITSEFSAVATADGVAALSVTMATALFDPPAGQAFFTPGNDVLVTATITNNGTGSTDPDSVFVTVAISPDMALFNDVTPALGGVIGFATAAPALTFTPGTDLRFSNSAAAPASLAQCTYTPAPGYDPQVRHVCLNPKGTLPAGATQGQFTVQLRARIN